MSNEPVHDRPAGAGAQRTSHWPPKLLALRARYLEEVREDVRTLAGLLTDADGHLPSGEAGDLFRKLAHDLRGTGGTYGFGAISHWAARVEEGWKAGLPAEEVAAAVSQLETATETASAGDPQRFPGIGA